MDCKRKFGRSTRALNPARPCGYGGLVAKATFKKNNFRGLGEEEVKRAEEYLPSTPFQHSLHLRCKQMNLLPAFSFAVQQHDSALC
jgi:hypothetical protein